MSNCPRCGTVRLLPAMPTIDGKPVQMCSVCHRIDLKETWDERRDFCSMTTIDHQQAAVRAIADALHGDACPADPDPGESCGCGDYEREAEIALTAAAPHLRAEFIAEVRRAQFEVEARHHFGFGEGGIKCLCGFESVRNRSRTEHITGAVLDLLEGGGE